MGRMRCSSEEKLQLRNLMPKPNSINLPSECEDLHFTGNAFKHGVQLFHGTQPFYFCCLDKTNAMKKCTNLYIQ